MDYAMMKALAEDGEKLRQLTGQDHGSWDLCDGCGVIVGLDCIVFSADGSERFFCDECRPERSANE